MLTSTPVSVHVIEHPPKCNDKSKCMKNANVCTGKKEILGAVVQVGTSLAVMLSGL